MQLNYSKLTLGVNVGESFEIGDSRVTVKEMRGKKQVAIQIEAPRTTLIKRKGYAPKTRDIVSAEAHEDTQIPTKYMGS